MSQKKITKHKTGRKPINIDAYFAKMEEYLNIGLSIYQSAINAGVPYRTVMDYYNQDERFRSRVDRARNNMVTLSRRKFSEAVSEKKKFSDPHKYVLDNLDEEFGKKKEGQTINFNTQVNNVNVAEEELEDFKEWRRKKIIESIRQPVEDNS